MKAELTDKEILDVAAQHCEFTPDGTYHLSKYREWAIVRVVRECFELADLTAQALESAEPSSVLLHPSGER